MKLAYRPNAWNLLYSVFAAVSLAAYGYLVLIRAALTPSGGFAGTYTFAWILRYLPAELWRSYDPDWFQARVIQAGIEKIREILYIQPPTMSFILWPLSAIPPQPARLLWTVLSLAAFVLGLLLLARALDLPYRAGLMLAPLLLWYVPVVENFITGQVYLFLFLLLNLWIWGMSRGRVGPAGSALGMMAALKTAGLWLWPQLLFSKRWRVLLWAAILAGMIALASVPLVGPAAWRAYFGALPALATSPKRFVTAYQTTTSLAGHLLVHDETWNPEPAADLPAAGQVLPALFTASALLINVIALRRPSETHETGMLETALMSSLMVTAVPVAEGYHYTLVLPALLIALWWTWRSRRLLVSWLVLVACAFLLGAPLPYRSPQVAAGLLAVVAYPRVYGASLLWMYLLWAHRSTWKSKGPHGSGARMEPRT